MKIAEPDNIRAGEQELINTIMKELNSEIIESIASGRLAVNNLEFRNGDMVVHNNRIAYKMEFQTSLSISVLFDREGNLIDEIGDNPEEESFAEAQMADEPMQMDDSEADAETIDGGQPEFSETDIDFEALQQEMAQEDVESEEDSELEMVLAKTRDFWTQQSQEAMAPVDTTEAEGDDALQEVMAKNQAFWQEQAAAAASN